MVQLMQNSRVDAGVS